MRCEQEDGRRSAKDGNSGLRLLALVGLVDDLEAQIVRPAGQMQFASALQQIDEPLPDELLAPAAQQQRALARFAGQEVQQLAQPLGAADQIVPQVFLSGVLWSIETMPRVLQYLAYALPLTYANLALRKLMIKGFALHQVVPELAALIAFALLMIGGSILTMRRSLY